MDNFKFVSYTATPTDQYMLGIAKIKVAIVNPTSGRQLGDLELRYKHVKTKDGSGTFFTPANYTTTDSTGEKKYISCFLFDSRSADDEVQDFLRNKVNQALAQRSVHETSQTGQIIRSMDEVSVNEALPF